ncbi:DNA breaking-rejoining protein [Salmonella enterica]|nr:recombination protein NinG [Salmonella enterica]EHG3619977.1 DNA breaking-rejoining protein [Salmonella enterica subsp. enterica serovar 6,8,[20]:e,h-]EAO0313152.1 DNA breaking-rejoining protein [Salmonella enterica]EAT1502267.1 DNA breaking-rejoining protein [Salmonella enterica]EBF0430997.1 DNA breaking-rejoining protein [Salmonella enterica]EBU8481664.1 DNA breaking-rejoining protein [Salmonella enterica subsp. enterica serovar Newport]
MKMTWFQHLVCTTEEADELAAGYRRRAALVERYGEAAVLALENNNTPHRWTVEELKEVRLAALADLRALKKLEAA